MPTGEVTLQSLTSVIESLQDAIRRNGRTIGSNETRTRNALIDPLLEVLGWADSSVVTPEYLVRYGTRDYEYGVVDYALHPPEDRANPMAFLEAKRMREDLTDDHRDQVLTYALDKGGKLQQFALTNGDRWELYELNEGEPFKIFEFSIRKQSASDCADSLVRHFPMLNKPSVESSPMPTQTLQVAAHSAGPISRVPEIHVLPSRQLTNHVDVPKALSWLAVSLVVFGILGWASGVWNAQPVEGFFEYVGLLTIAIAIILTAALLRRLYPPAVSVILRFLRLKWLFAPIKGNRRKTFMWVGLSIVCGIGFGGVGGHFIGLQTGQAVVDALEDLGRVVVAIAIGILILLIAVEIVRSSGKRRRGGWRPRSSYRKRRW